MDSRSRKATIALIRRARGILKGRTGGKSIIAGWPAHKRREKELEDRLIKTKLARFR